MGGSVRALKERQRWSYSENGPWRKSASKLMEGMDGTQYWDEARREKVEQASARFVELLTEEWLAHGRE